MIVADTDTEAANLIERTEGSFGATTLGLLLPERRNVKVLRAGSRGLRGEATKCLGFERVPELPLG